ETGIFDQDRHQMMCAIDDAQAFLKIGAAVTGLNMKVTDFNRAKEVATRLEPALARRQPLDVKPWNERNKTLMEAVQIEKFLIYFVIIFMMLLAGLCLSAIMTMSVIEK